MKRSTNSDHRIGGWMRDMADMADAIVAFPRRCLQWRVIVTLHPLAPFHPKPVYTRGSGAHGRGAASHISRLIVSICRAPSIRQFRHWTVSGPKRSVVGQEIETLSRQGWRTTATFRYLRSFVHSSRRIVDTTIASVERSGVIDVARSWIRADEFWNKSSVDGFGTNSVKTGHNNYLSNNWGD